MAYHVLPRRLKQLGYCCAMTYFAARDEYSTGQIAKELKVHLRTARRWRSKYRNTFLHCESNLNCLQTELYQCLPQTAVRTESLYPLPTFESGDDLDE